MGEMKRRRQLKFLKEIPEGGRWPRWYGFAYRNPEKLNAVCAPLPLNFIVGALWKLRIWMKLGFGRKDSLSEQLNFAYIDARSQREHIRLLEQELNRLRHVPKIIP